MIREVTQGEYSVSVREATGLDGMRRQILRSEAFKPDGKGLKPVSDDEATQIMRLVSYPDLTACLVSSSGLPEPLTFEAFCELPDRLLDAWGKAVYELNPHWLGMEETKEDQKKVSKSGEGSQDS